MDVVVKLLFTINSMMVFIVTKCCGYDAIYFLVATVLLDVVLYLLHSYAKRITGKRKST